MVFSRWAITMVRASANAWSLTSGFPAELLSRDKEYAAEAIALVRQDPKAKAGLVWPYPTLPGHGCGVNQPGSVESKARTIADHMETESEDIPRDLRLGVLRSCGLAS